MLVFAHRGASGDYPENTLLAMEKAIEQQSHGIEFDVQQAKDGLVVTHDRLIKNELNEKLWVAQHTVAELKQIVLPYNQQVPTLDEVMECIGGHCQANIELKTLEHLHELKEVLHRSTSEYGFFPEQLLISSFNHHILQTVATWGMNIRIGALTASLPADYASFATQLRVNSVHADVNALSKEFVKDTQARGMHMLVYTVDQELDIVRMMEWGVDGIFSNYPQQARDVIAAYSEQLR